MMRKTKILIVDDKPENVLALANLIASPDVEVVKAVSGNEALEMLLKHEVALALLDVQMPVVNGFEVARFMRSAVRTRTIPIIFVTAAQVSQGSIFEGYESGAVDYLTKPLDAHIVRSKVRVFVDLDQRTKALEQKLREVEVLKIEAEESSRAKSRFLANMSHEIRTPLGAVLGFSELLKFDDQPSEDRQTYITAIERNGKLLLKLIDDILDISKIEADRIETERAKIPLVELIRDLESMHGLRAAEKGVRLTIKASGPLPRSVSSDAVRLKQILNNLIGNAVKFTAKGSVDVTVSIDPPQGDAPAQLRFVISDTGCGLSAAESARLFQPFMQADSSTKRRYGGTGLGLTIAKRLANLLGGDVALVRADKDGGSTFEATIDPGSIDHAALEDGARLLGAPAATGTPVAALENRLVNRRILIVDDALDNRTLMKRVIERSGAAVDVGENGLEGVEKAMAGTYDVVILDIQMPVMDGYEAATELRRRGFDRPMIALTAHAMAGERERCLSAGFDGYLSKPIVRADLVEAIANMAEFGRNAAPGSSAALLKK